MPYHKKNNPHNKHNKKKDNKKKDNKKKKTVGSSKQKSILNSKMHHTVKKKMMDHAIHHTQNHLNFMIGKIENGKKFSEAHLLAQKAVGR